MDMLFRKVNSKEAFTKTKIFLTKDVIANGGSASEVIDMHGILVHVTVCKVPWGTLLIHKEVSRLEALAWMTQEID